MSNQISKNYPPSVQTSALKLSLVGQMAVIGRKIKQISAANLSNTQWFLLLYVAGFSSLLLVVTLLKVAMKLI